MRGRGSPDGACYQLGMVAIEFDHRLAEHLRARRLFYRKKSWLARAGKVVAIALGAFGVILVSLVGPRWWTLVWFLLAPLEWFDLLSIEPLVERWVFERSAKFRERTSLSFSEECIRYRTPSIDSTLDWTLFGELLEDDELFLLTYRAPRSYAVIPKRAFATEEERAVFRRLVRRRVAHAAA